MKQIKALLLAGLSTFFFIACGGGSSDSTPPPTDTTPKLSYINLSNSNSLMIAQNSSNYISKSLNIGVDTNTSPTTMLKVTVDTNAGPTTLLKVTDDGYIQEVTYTDEDGMEYISTSAPLYMENINSSYMLLAFGDDTFNIAYTYLIRKSDGAMYDLEESLFFPLNGFENDKIIKTDSMGNIYVLVVSPINVDGNLVTNILKIDITVPETIVKTIINPDTDSVDHFEVDNNGNIIYWYWDTSGMAGEITASRIIKANNEMQNIADTYAFWRGLDGVIYSQSSNDNNITKHAISDDYTYTANTIEYSEGVYCDIAWNSYIIDTTKSILITDWADNNICEVYNDSMIPRKLNTDLNSIKAVEQNENYYYIAGNNNNDNPVLRRFNPVDDTYIDILAAGEYDVYEFTVSSSNDITFNALRMSDGIKVIGEVSPEGIVTIIDSESNNEVIAIEAIN